MSNHILSRISELHRSIDSLRNQSTNDPDRIEKALTEAIEELQAIPQEVQGREQYEITKAEQAEETLWQSKVRFRVLTRNLSSGVVLLDPSGKIAEYNSAFLKMFGLADDPSKFKDICDQTGRTGKYSMKMAICWI